MEEIKEADKIIEELDNVTYEKVEMIRTKLEKCTSSFSDIRVQGHGSGKAREDALLMLAEMTSILDKGMNELKNLYKRIPKEDRNLRIYFDKVYFRMSNKDLIIKYDLTKQQINRIIKKIKESM